VKLDPKMKPYKSIFNFLNFLNPDLFSSTKQANHSNSYRQKLVEFESDRKEKELRKRTHRVISRMKYFLL
jgi:hypothetical protein